MPTNKWQCTACEKVKMTPLVPTLMACPHCGERSWLLMKGKGNLGLTYDGSRQVLATPEAVTEQYILGGGINTKGFQAANTNMDLAGEVSVVIGVMQGDVFFYGRHGPTVQKTQKQRPSTRQWAGHFKQYVGEEATWRTQPTSSSKGLCGDSYTLHLGESIGVKKDNTPTRWRCAGCGNGQTTRMSEGYLFCSCCGGATWYRLDDKAVPRGGKIYDKHAKGIIAAPKTVAQGTILGWVDGVVSKVKVLKIKASGPVSIVIGAMQGDVFAGR